MLVVIWKLILYTLKFFFGRKGVKLVKNSDPLSIRRREIVFQVISYCPFNTFD